MHAWRRIADGWCEVHIVNTLFVQVTPERVRELAKFTLEDAWKLTK